MSLSARMDTSKITARLDRMAGNLQSAVIPAAQAGAQVFYEEVRARAPVGTKAEHYFYGEAAKKARKGNKKAKAYLFSRGTLKDSIYQYRKRYYDDGGHATYVIAWNHREAPYGYMVENGTSHSAAHPFLRPAYDAAADRAQHASAAVLRAAARKEIGA